MLVTEARDLKAKTGHLRRLWGPGLDPRLGGGRGGRGRIQSVLQLPEPLWSLLLMPRGRDRQELLLGPPPVPSSILAPQVG